MPVPRGIVTGTEGAIWLTENLGIGRMTTGGKLTEFHLPDGNGSGMPYQIAVGPEHNIWFAEEPGGTTGKLERLHTLLISRQATIAIQVQPVMMAMRWRKPVGAFGQAPSSSMVDTAVLAMNIATMTTPTVSE